MIGILQFTIRKATRSTLRLVDPPKQMIPTHFGIIQAPDKAEGLNEILLVE